MSERAFLHADGSGSSNNNSSTAWPLTEAQSGLWYAQQLAPDNPSFNTAHALWIDGALDTAAFAAAADRTAGEAQSLVLRLRADPGGPVQWVDPARTPWLETVDLRTQDDPTAAARAAMQADLQTPIDPVRDRLARQCLFVLGEQRFVWYQRAHHLANDGYGMALWSTRVGELYERYASPAQPAGAAPLPDRAPLGALQAVVDEDAAYLQGERRVRDGAFWREAFTPLPDVVGMAAGRAVSAFHCHRRVVPLADALRARLMALAEASGQPWPDVLTAVTALYALRMAGTAQTVIGVPFMGRMGSASARATATVMNVLPLRVAAAPDALLVDVIRELALAQVRARRHGRYRSEQLRRDLGLLGGQRRLHAALVNVQPFYKPLSLAGVRVSLEILGTGPIDDITIGFRGDGAQALDLEIEAHPTLYSAASVDAHLARLQAFLEAATQARTVGDIPLASPAEARRHLFDLNATDHPVPDTTLVALIEATMARTPQAVALEFDGEAMTYAELDARTQALATRLRATGVGRDRLVAVALPRSLALPVALVAVLRAGGAYLPLDLAHPPERLARVVALSQPVCALVREEDAGRLPAALPRVPIDASSRANLPGAPAGGSAGPLTADVRPDDAAYVIYTSGSTGEPKGVVVTHRAIVNRLEWMRVHYGFAPGERILQKTPATFDVSVWEFFLPLTAGCTLVVAPPDAHRDPAWLAALVRQQRIGTCHFVPSMLAAFLSDPAARGLRMQRIFCSGEELPAALRDRLHATLDSELHNLYGPTEAAVDVSFWPADAQDRTQPVPIGHPVWNTRLYVLDARMRALPPGVPGDLYLGGVQLARGYLGRDDLTAERFLPDPHRPGERIYKTGDLARWREEDGTVVFLGRSDHQVKLRGLRIELGEIEAALTADASVLRAEVLLREESAGDRRLVAYVHPGAGYDAGRLRQHLAARLPDYMVPAALVELRDWPVTANGKLDRAALPAPRTGVQDAPRGRPPQGPTEQALAALFADVLGIADAAQADADADFFALGGDSLAAVQLLLQVQARWQRNPGLGTLFARPTVAALAEAIDAEAVRFDSGLAPLIPLATGDAARAPLYVVHPAGGIAWGYRPLAQALAQPASGPSRSVFGLQSPALAPEAALPDSIDALARQYVGRILAVQPRGPFHLLGWSVGGIIAQAMAVELQAAGHAVGLIALLDAYPADVWRDEPEPTPMQALRALLAIAGLDPEGHPELTTRDAVVDFLRRSDTALGHLPAEALQGVVRVVTDTNRLIRQHHHRRQAGTLTHVRAGRDHAGKPQLRADEWRPYAQQVDTLELPLMHAQMTGAEATARLAPALAERMAATPGDLQRPRVDPRKAPLTSLP